MIKVGKVGISSELFDADGPTFYIHRSRIGQLKEVYRKHGLKKNGTFIHTNAGKLRRETKFNGLREDERNILFSR